MRVDVICRVISVNLSRFCKLAEGTETVYSCPKGDVRHSTPAHLSYSQRCHQSTASKG
jgi:hypothetical protein